MTPKKTILILTAHYIPGFKGGGPIRSIEGFVHQFNREYNIKIITKDRDRNDIEPYKDLELDSWCDNGEAQIIYLKKNFDEYYKLFKIIKKTHFDVMYINSFFNPQMSIFPIILRSLYLIPTKSLIMAPRGEFSPEALKIRKIRKLIYIKFFKLLKTTQTIFWQASSKYEKLDILQNITNISNERVFIAGNLSKSLELTKEQTKTTFSDIQQNKLRLIYLSRISLKKNLDFALHILSKLEYDIEFDIFGPIEDQIYWYKCMKIIEDLPDNIKVKYCGTLSHEKVTSILANYDLFFFPTRGENYGHVIEEAIHAGLPILISDQTPWKNLEQIGIGRDVSLLNIDGFIDYLSKIYKMNPENRIQIKQNVIKYSARLSDKTDIINSNRLMLESALSESNSTISN